MESGGSAPPSSESRTGEGPREFRGNFGLQIDKQGLVWAADPDLARLTALDEPVFSLSAIAIAESAVVVLGNGGGEGRNRHLDRYAISDCRYLGSMELPGRFSAMAYDGGRFVLESHDPVPTVTALSWRAKEM